MAVYDPSGNYVAESLRKAAVIIGCSHTAIANCSDTREGNHYMRELPDPTRGRGPDRQPRKRIERVRNWWDE